MGKYIILSEKDIHYSLFRNLSDSNKNDEWVLINSKDKFTPENLKSINPDYIFIPHWSYIIPEKIYSKFRCVIFHMTDLPYGRGGSPLQNLIIRGHQKTKISAILAVREVDAGPILMKADLGLHGNAQEIFLRASGVINEMIQHIINNNPVPVRQEGEVTFFKRRTPEMSRIERIQSIDKLYDFIRMLDAEGYPNAFITKDLFRIEFSNAKLEDNSLTAHVRIFKK